MRILGKPASLDVRKLPWTCAELGLEYALEPWGADLATRTTQRSSRRIRTRSCPC